MLRFCTDVLTEHKKHEDYYLKMEAIDIAFARYIASRDPKTGEVQEKELMLLLSILAFLMFLALFLLLLFPKWKVWLVFVKVFLSGSPFPYRV